MGEVPLYNRLMKEMQELEASQTVKLAANFSAHTLQGYLAHKKPPPP